MINGQTTTVTPLGLSGFCSSYELPGRRPNAGKQYTEQKVAAVMARAPELALKATADLEEIRKNMLKRPRLTGLNATAYEIARHTEIDKGNLADSLSRYTSLTGEHVLMNIGALGYESIQDYVAALDSLEESDPGKRLKEYIDQFHEDHSNLRLTPDGKVDGASSYLEAAATLSAFLLEAPAVSGQFYLAKGVSSDNSPSLCSTHVNSQAYLSTLMNGHGVLHGGFLSTTPDVNAAIQFLPSDDASFFENPRYSIDLDGPAGNSDESEILRRDAEVALKDEDSISFLNFYQPICARGMALAPLGNLANAVNFANIAAKEVEFLFTTLHTTIPRLAIRVDE